MRPLLPTMLGLALLLPGAGAADGRLWEVEPPFRSEAAAEQMSGAVCPGADRRLAWCVAVNDEKKYLQLFAVDREDERLVPGDRLRLLPRRGDGPERFDEPDIEAAAAEGGWLYAIGSHGTTRGGGETQPSRFFVYRLPVDPATGRPGVEITRDRVAEGIARSAALGPLIAADPRLAPFVGQPLQANGVTVEGLAALGGTLHAGFRQPVLEAGAAILSVPAARLFDGAPGAVETHVVDLGRGYGIRAMERLGDGLLLLAGAGGEAELVPAVWFWRPGAPARLLRVLRVPKGQKAEGLTILETAGARIDTLVFFDGEPDGGPRLYKIPRP